MFTVALVLAAAGTGQCNGGFPAAQGYQAPQIPASVIYHQVVAQGPLWIPAVPQGQYFGSTGFQGFRFQGGWQDLRPGFRISARFGEGFSVERYGRPGAFFSGRGQ